METVFIRNMVCNRCIMAVQNELNKLGVPVKNIRLGEVTLEKLLTPGERTQFSESLNQLGFELIDDKKSRLIERIKSVIIEQVLYQGKNGNKENLSELLSSTLQHDYSYLSNLFSAIEGTTIEQYHIAQKIEKVKELLVYDEMTLSEIADLLYYSSAAHLSNQFKKVTGLTPGHFKQIGLERRKPLDKVIQDPVAGE